MGSKRTQNQEDAQLVGVLQHEINRHRRDVSLPDSAIPEMQRRLREVCERHGWRIPREGGP